MSAHDASGTDDQRSGPLRNTIYRQVTRSNRRMGRTRRALYALAAPLLLGLMRLWWRSCRVVAVVGEEHLDAALALAPSFLPCYWHQHQLFCARYLLQAQERRRLRVGFLISPSVDGELAAMIVRRAGGVVIRGSSSHTGALALKGYFEALTREQVSPVINPDGPRGPRFKFKPGAVLLAQISGRADAAAGLRCITRVADPLGSVRAADARLPHRHRRSDRRSRCPACSVRRLSRASRAGWNRRCMTPSGVPTWHSRALNHKLSLYSYVSVRESST